MSDHSTAQHLINELDELAGALRDGHLDDSGASRLRALINEQPTLRRRLAEHLFLSAALKEGASTGMFDRPAPERKANRFWRWSALAASAAAIVAVLLIALLSDPGGSSDLIDGSSTDMGPEPLEMKGIAVVTRMVEANWSGQPVRDGQTLQAGSLSLVTGLAQLEFYCGATMILEGPASIELISPELAVIHQGKLRANVPPTARGFTIRYRDFDIVDLGTEFGVEVGAGGNAEVHVLDGEVKVENASDPGSLLSAGEALAFSATGTRTIPADASQFVGPDHLDERALEAMTRRELAWRASMDKLRKDPALMALYTFEETKGWGRTLHNSAPGSAPATAGAVVGCEWTEGRWPGKSALAFANSSHRVRIDVPGSYESLTLGTWVRVDSFPGHVVALLNPDTDQDRFVHWNLFRVAQSPYGKVQQHIADTHDTAGQESRIHYASPKEVSRDSELGQWLHWRLRL